MLNRRDYLRVGILSGSAILSGNRSQGQDQTKGRARLGINLSGPADWNSELPFVDVFRMSRPWISQREGAKFGGGPPLLLDEFGWVRRLEPGCWAESLLCTDLEGHSPRGVHHVFYRGKGELAFGNSAQVLQARPGHIRIDVDPRKGNAISVQLRQTDPADPVRDLRVILPGVRENMGTRAVPPDFSRSLERVRLPEIHGLDAHERVGIAKLGKPADVETRDILSAWSAP